MYGHAGAARRTFVKRRTGLPLVIETFVPLHVMVGEVAIAGRVVLIRIG
ncbi:MAG: hypothetical protein NTAFB05_12610 [Nitrobacter sp.]